MIITAHAGDIIKTFEEIGFERRYTLLIPDFPAAIVLFLGSPLQLQWAGAW